MPKPLNLHPASEGSGIVAVKEAEAAARSKDGTELFYRRWRVGSPRGCVLIVHGYADHSGRYPHVAKFLNEVGLDVFAADVRGHGKSGGARGHTMRFDRYLEDVDAALEAMRRDGASGPAFVLGHSHGGLIALNYALHRKPDWRGLIVTSPFLGVAMKVPPVKLAAGRLMSKLFPSFSLPSEIPPEYLSHESDVVRGYANDPLVFKTATARWFTEAMGAIDEVYDRAGEIKVPTLMLAAGDDRVADPSKAEPLFQRLGAEDKQFVSYAGFYHEILNETEKERVFAEIRPWIERRL